MVVLSPHVQMHCLITLYAPHPDSLPPFLLVHAAINMVVPLGLISNIYPVHPIIEITIDVASKKSHAFPPFFSKNNLHFLNPLQLSA